VGESWNPDLTNCWIMPSEHANNKFAAEAVGKLSLFFVIFLSIIQPLLEV